MSTNGDGKSLGGRKKWFCQGKKFKGSWEDGEAEAKREAEREQAEGKCLWKGQERIGRVKGRGRGRRGEQKLGGQACPVMFGHMALMLLDNY